MLKQSKIPFFESAMNNNSSKIIPVQVASDCEIGLQNQMCKRAFKLFEFNLIYFFETCSPSSANIENLDMKEMYYNKSQKDLTEEKIHHLLSENLFMPRNRVRLLRFWTKFYDIERYLMKLYGIRW